MFLGVVRLNKVTASAEIYSQADRLLPDASTSVEILLGSPVDVWFIWQEPSVCALESDWIVVWLLPMCHRV
jgi:hypothetical protein